MEQDLLVCVGWGLVDRFGFGLLTNGWLFIITVIYLVS